MRAATVIGRRDAARAAVLAESFARAHPDGDLVIASVEPLEDELAWSAAGRVVMLEELDVDLTDWQARAIAALAPAEEVVRAAVPFLLRGLLAEDRAPVVYLEASTTVRRSLAPLATHAAQRGLALVPHTRQPMPDDGFEPGRSWIAEEGAFSAGCLGAGGRAIAFLEWWGREILATYVLDERPRRAFTSLDLAAATFPGAVVDEPCVELAFWNTHEHVEPAAALPVGGECRLANFRGYDVDQPWRYSVAVGERPRVLLGEVPAIAADCDEYRTALRTVAAPGVTVASSTPPRSRDGVVLTDLVRSAYRRGLRDAHYLDVERPPGPFDADGGGAFRRWLEEPSYGPVNAKLSRFALEFWSASAVAQQRFPDGTGFDAAAYDRWFSDEPAARLAVAAAGLSPPAEPSRSIAPAEVGGWNVVGYFSAELGVGEAGRRLATSIEAAGIPTELVGVSTGYHRTRHPLRRPVAESLRYRDSVYSINAAELDRVIALAGETRVPRGRRLAQWFWEVDRFPDRWRHAFDMVDEVWVQSHFTEAVLAPISPVPVRHVPLAVRPPSRPTPYRRSQLGLPDGFVFLFCYDYFSVMDRKNPLALLDAYTRAFGPRDGASLVLKSINGGRRPAQLDRLRQAARSRPDVVILDAFMDPPRVQGLIELADCFVSLHRAEGFGLNLAAAMACGTPVVATAYSGNMDFMDDDSAFLVPYDLVAVGPGNDPYPADAHWAEPDLDAAAAQMRLVFDDPEVAARHAAAGRALVAERQSLTRSAAAVAAGLLGFVPAHLRSDVMAGSV